MRWNLWKKEECTSGRGEYFVDTTNVDTLIEYIKQALLCGPRIYAISMLLQIRPTWLRLRMHLEEKVAVLTGDFRQCDIDEVMRGVSTIHFLPTRRTREVRSIHDPHGAYLAFEQVEELAVQAPNLQLLPHQSQGVAWMLSREEVTLQERVHQTFEQKVCKDIGFQKAYISEFENVREYRGGLLADAPGLGKTIQTLALIALTKQHAMDWVHEMPTFLERKSLAQTMIVVPPVLIPQWKSEFAKYTPGITVATLTPTVLRRLEPVRADVLIVSLSQFKAMPDFMGYLQKHYWYRIVIDEAHILNNGWREMRAARNITLSTVARARSMWALTATPGKYGVQALRAAFCEPKFEKIFRQIECKDTNYGSRNFTILYEGVPFCLDDLKDLTVLARQRSSPNVVGMDLPACTRQTVPVPVTHDQADVAEYIERWANKALGSNQFSQAHKFAVIQRLQRANQHDVRLLSPAALARFGFDQPLNPEPSEPVLDPRITAAHQEYLAEHSTCAICLDLMDEPAALVGCMHVYCYGCITSLPASRLKCPLCRVPFRPSDVCLFHPPDAGLSTDAAPDAIRAAYTRITAVPHPPPRVAAMLTLLASVPAGEQCVVFTSLAAAIPGITQALTAAGISHTSITGHTSAAGRRRAFDAFYGGAARVFVLGIRSGAVGLNLTCANHLIFLEPQASPDVETQAVGRIHRYGQRKPVTITTLGAFRRPEPPRPVGSAGTGASKRKRRSE